MKKNQILFNKKQIRNTRDGHNLNSKYWQNWKKSLPLLPLDLIEIAIGMILGDGSMYKKKIDALIKFEQGYKQTEFLIHLFELFKGYCFMIEPGKRIELRGDRKGLLKSLWFKTFSHSSFTEIWNLFYVNGSNKKSIQKGLVLNHLSAKGLAYWIMCDGSLQNDKKTMILHTQSFSYEENLILSNELNKKFNFKTKVISHKVKYYVIKFDSNDAFNLKNLIKPFMHLSLSYKIPILD
jgi:LAGLIDADG DNA endonuclease family